MRTVLICELNVIKLGGRSLWREVVTLENIVNFESDESPILHFESRTSDEETIDASGCERGERKECIVESRLSEDEDEKERGGERGGCFSVCMCTYILEETGRQFPTFNVLY